MAAKVTRCAHIYDQHHRELAFLGKLFHERAAEPCRYVPIDRANLIARLIFAHLFKIHPATLEDAVVIAGEGGFDQSAGLDFEPADLLQNLGGCTLPFFHWDQVRSDW